MRMPDQHGPIAHAVVDIFVAVDIPFARSERMVDVGRGDRIVPQSCPTPPARSCCARAYNSRAAGRWDAKVATEVSEIVVMQNSVPARGRRPVA